jgi:hypothetical protein
LKGGKRSLPFFEAEESKAKKIEIKARLTEDKEEKRIKA